MELNISQFPLYTQKLNLMMQFLSDVFDAEIKHQHSSVCLASFNNLNLKLIEIDQNLKLDQNFEIELFANSDDLEEFLERYSFFCFKHQINLPKTNVHYTQKIEILDPDGRTWVLQTQNLQKNLISNKFFGAIQS